MIRAQAQAPWKALSRLMVAVSDSSVDTAADADSGLLTLDLITIDV